MWDFNDSELKQLAEGKFVLDCLEISATPFSPTSSRRSYIGPGSITQTGEGDFLLKSFGKGMEDPFEVLSTRNITPGRIIDESEYYSLSACDVRGRKWTAKKVIAPGI